MEDPQERPLKISGFMLYEAFGSTLRVLERVNMRPLAQQLRDLEQVSMRHLAQC